MDKFKTQAPTGNTFLFWLDGGARIYRSEDAEMVAITTMDDFNQFGYSLSGVVNLSSNTVSRLFTSTDRLALPPGSMYMIPSVGRVYVLDGDKKSHPVLTGDTFADFTFSWRKVRDINQSTLSYYSQGVNLSSLVTTPDGNRWLVSAGRHYGLPTQLSLSYDPTQSAYTPLSYASLDYSIRSRDATRFIRIGNDSRVYYMDDGVKYPLGSVNAFTSRGGTSWDMVISISDNTARQFPTGQTLY